MKSLFSALFGPVLLLSTASAAALEDGLVAFYPFNGNASDESGNQNHARHVSLPDSTLVSTSSPVLAQLYVLENTPPPQSTVTFFDGTFENSNWVLTTAFDSTPPGSSNGSASQVATGGNPESYRSTTLVFGTGIFAVSHMNALAVFNPASQGAITSVDYSYDFIKLVPTGFGAINYMLAVMQNGTLYVHPGEAPGNESWTTYRHAGLVTSDFSSIAPNGFFGGTQHPDFSSTAPALQFGYVTLNSSPEPTASSTSGIDNWTVQLHITPPVPCLPHRATGIATVVNGFVVGVEITDPGCGYETAPLVQLSGGGGTGAIATATVTGGIVTSISISNAGSGYTDRPRVQVASPPFTPWLRTAVSKITVTQHVVLGKNYILEASPDLQTWTAVGAQFTAEDEEITQEFDVAETGRYFRIRQVP